jgi:Tfp pilus assembly protein PilF
MAPPNATAPSDPHPTPSGPPSAEAEAMVREAQQAWVRQHYALAISRARDALAIAPDQPLAHQLIALCSCALQRSEDAKQAMAHLDPAKQRLVRTLCQKDGVTLDPE